MTFVLSLGFHKVDWGQGVSACTHALVDSSLQWCVHHWRQSIQRRIVQGVRGKSDRSTGAIICLWLWVCGVVASRPTQSLKHDVSVHAPLVSMRRATRLGSALLLPRCILKLGCDINVAASSFKLFGLIRSVLQWFGRSSAMLPCMHGACVRCCFTGFACLRGCREPLGLRCPSLCCHRRSAR